MTKVDFLNKDLYLDYHKNPMKLHVVQRSLPENLLDKNYFYLLPPRLCEDFGTV
jgi:hypothetical protein